MHVSILCLIPGDIQYHAMMGPPHTAYLLGPYYVPSPGIPNTLQMQKYVRIVHYGRTE